MDGVQLNPTSRLSRVFTDGPEDEQIHIIVRRPAGARRGSVDDPTDIMVELNKREATSTGF
jgi:hypothetical protein